jgi:type I restriction enzyme M protein
VNAQSLVAKVWNFAHVLRDQGVSYQAYISQISYLLFLKMDEERVGLIGEASLLPEGARWVDIRDLAGEALSARYTKILDRLASKAASSAPSSSRRKVRFRTRPSSSASSA